MSNTPGPAIHGAAPSVVAPSLYIGGRMTAEERRTTRRNTSAIGQLAEKTDVRCCLRIGEDAEESREATPRRGELESLAACPRNTVSVLMRV